MLHRRLDQLVAQSGDLGAQRVGDRDLHDPRSELVVPDEGLHRDDVDHAGEEVALAERVLDRVRVGAQALSHHGDDLLEVGADAVHLVDEGDARHAVAVGLAPHRLGLRLDAADRAEHRDRAVEHPERALHLGGEVDVARGVDDVDAVLDVVAHPVRGGRRRGDGDAAFLFLFHPVHRGRALVDLAHAMEPARVEQDALGGRRLPGIDVRHDADVPKSRKRCLPHLYALSNSSSAVTSDSGRRPCSPPPCDGCRPSSSRSRPRPGSRPGSRRPGAATWSAPRAGGRSRRAT